MLKKYIVLVSSLIACSSRAMDQYSDIQCYGDASKTIEDVMRYRYNPDISDAQFRAIYIADKEIQKLERSNLTEDDVLSNIEQILKPYESIPVVSEEIQKLYKTDGIKAIKVKTGGVLRFDVNESGSRVALQFANGADVYEEKSRGVWSLLKGYNVRYCLNNMVLSNMVLSDMVLSGDGKQLVWKYDKACLKADLDGTPDELSVDYTLELEEKMQSGQRFRRMGDAIGVLAFSKAEKEIHIERDGFRVKYQPTLREIAAYLVMKAKTT